jgi:tetratricopeptide (TPR) repeat protein
LAGAYLHTTRIRLSKYSTLLQPDRIRDTLSYRPPAAVWEYSKNVFSTWELSFQEISKASPEAAELLSICAFYSNTDINPDMLERGISALKIGSSVNLLLIPLISFSLIMRKATREGDDGDEVDGDVKFSIHPLIHEWTRERLSPDKKISLSKKAFRLVCATLKATEIWTTGVRTMSDWAHENDIIQHLDSALVWVLELVRPTENLLEHLDDLILVANVYFYAGRYDDAETVYLKVLDLTSAGESSPSHRTLNVLQGIATVNRFQGKWEDCERRYRQVLKAREAADIDHLDTLATVQSLAVLCRHKGMYDTSNDLYRWALNGKHGSGTGIVAQQGMTHPNTVHTQLGYAIVLQLQGHFDEALCMYERVVDHRAKTLGSEHPDTLTVLHSIASVSHSLGRLERAEELNLRVLACREKSLGPNHPDTLRTMVHLANARRDLGNYLQAEQHYAKALRHREECLGFHHADTLATVHSIAVCYRMQGKLDEASKYYGRALSGREGNSLLGPGHVDTLRTVEGLGMVAEERHDYAVAESLYLRVLSGFESQLAPGCSELRRALENVARARRKGDRPGESAVFRKWSGASIEDVAGAKRAL